MRSHVAAVSTRLDITLLTSVAVSRLHARAACLHASWRYARAEQSESS